MACCESCKISGMGKKKHHKVSGTKGDLTTTVITAVAVPVGAVAAHEAKAYLIPMLYATTDTDAQKATKQLYGNLGATALGVLAVVGGHMLESKEPEIGAGVKGLGLGVIAHCFLSLYLNHVKAANADGTANNRINAWDAKAWQAAKKKALGMSGADNAANGIMGNRFRVNGADNAANGIMGPLQKPLLTKIDTVGSHFRVNGCGL